MLNFNFYLLFVAQVYPVALPDGTTFLPPDHLPFFANYSITFWFPDTIGSFDACKSFAKKIGEEKCRTMTRDIPQPSVSLMKAQKDVASYIRQNSLGKIIITVFPPIVSAETIFFLSLGATIIQGRKLFKGGNY